MLLQQQYKLSDRDIQLRMLLACMGLNLPDDDVTTLNILFDANMKPINKEEWNALGTQFWGRVNATDEPKNKVLLCFYYLTTKFVINLNNLKDNLQAWLANTMFISEGELVPLLWITTQSQADDLDNYIKQLKEECTNKFKPPTKQPKAVQKKK